MLFVAPNSPIPVVRVENGHRIQKVKNLKSVQPLVVILPLLNLGLLLKAIFKVMNNWVQF